MTTSEPTPGQELDRVSAFILNYLAEFSPAPALTLVVDVSEMARVTPAVVDAALKHLGDQVVWDSSTSPALISLAEQGGER